MFSELWKEITDTGSFLTSIQNVFGHFSVNSAIMLIMAIFIVVGAVDQIRGNRLGYGAKFEEGFHTLGSLALAMVGIIALTPILKQLLQPIIGPLYELFGASSAMFAGTVLPMDAGGYNLAITLTDDPSIARFSGIILAGLMGNIFTGVIPIIMSMIPKKEYGYLSAGILISLLSIPVACICGGLAMNLVGYPMDLGTILVNLIPAMILAAIIAVGVFLIPEKLMRFFTILAKAIGILLIIGLALAAFQAVSGIHLPLFDQMVESLDGESTPLESGLLTIGNIAVVLAGAFPMMLWLSRHFGKPIARISEKVGMNEEGGLGILAGLASVFPQLNGFCKMNPLSKLINVGFALSVDFVLGDHLAFVAGVDSSMILPMMITKFVSGIQVFLLSKLLAPRLLPSICKQSGEKY